MNAAAFVEVMNDPRVDKARERYYLARGAKSREGKIADAMRAGSEERRAFEMLLATVADVASEVQS